MRKLLATTFAGGLLATGAFLFPAHASYPNACDADGSSVDSSGSPAVYQSPGDPTSGSGYIGVVGPDGYLEAGGDANTQSGGISGSTAGGELYGSVSGSGVCVNGTTAP